MGDVDRDAVISEQLAHVLDEISRLEDDPGTGTPAEGRLAAEIRAHRRQADAMQTRLTPKTARS